MRERRLSFFRGSSDGSTTVEFVVVFLGFIAIILFVVEVTLYMFFLASLEKAAEAGVRAAVISPPVVPIATTNRKVANDSVRYGARCTSLTCEPPDERAPGCSPDGESCDGPAFEDVILPQMQRFSGQIQAENVEITYTYTGIGFAGGPAVPMVTVTVRDVPFRAGILGLLLEQFRGVDTIPLPPRSASMTGEDLAL